ncbi:hypothetical protein DP090_022525 [Pseudomonas sp. MDMC216]|jgi:hypothetical protein|nr:MULTISPECIES: hypothetical protein [unclassified Pseudomonas]MBA4681781.1 hypothetical protein [Pseudomonas sp.]MDI5995794.1 hypothetical protein [Pseudomonas sp. MDMC216]MDI6007101.1 hypothetical protein [Pseudomonas sp. MDMC17]
MNFNPDGSVMVSAFSLKTDSWHDFQYFLNECAEHERDERNRNRSLRAALFNLYAHFEAVVYDLGIVALSSKEKKGSLESRCIKISKKANLQGIQLYGRISRNEITHPGKDEAEPFEKLSQESLASWGMAIDAWLDQACKNLGVQRFADTKSIVRTFASTLGEHEEPREL